MSRILLADDSPHAQRMGERILREEGFEVVSLTDGDTTLVRLADVDPDLVLADVFLPNKSGLDICRHIKSSPRHRHVRVVLIAGLLEPFDEDEARRAGVDAILKKPFEASVVMETIRPLLIEARTARDLLASSLAPPVVEPELPVAPIPVRVVKSEPAQPEPSPAPEVPPPAIDPERVRAAVTVALDAALPALIEEITARVLVALGQ